MEADKGGNDCESKNWKSYSLSGSDTRKVIDPCRVMDPCHIRL
jgi:hypothetical protein